MDFESRLVRLLQSRFFNCFVLFFIAVSIVAVVLSSFRQLAPYRGLLFSINYLSSFVFLVEYAARIGCAPKLHPSFSPRKARMKYLFSFYGLVDFVAILPCVLAYFCRDTELIHLVILPYIFIIFKLIRHSRSFRIIGHALLLVRSELYTAYTACFIVICFSAIVMYYIEREAQPEAFGNIGDGLWWAVVTFTTTGYGDLYPITPMGKILGSIIAMVGIAMIAIPTAIISSSFISIMQHREQNEKNRPKE